MYRINQRNEQNSSSLVIKSIPELRFLLIPVMEVVVMEEVELI
jgi:hypothetical protein